MLPCWGTLPAQHLCTHACLRWSGGATLTPKALGSPVKNVSMGRSSGGWVVPGVCAPSGGSSNCRTPGGWHLEVGRMAGGGRRPLALLGGRTTNTPLLAGAADMVLGGPGRQRLRSCCCGLHICRGLSVYKQHARVALFPAVPEDGTTISVVGGASLREVKDVLDQGP